MAPGGPLAYNVHGSHGWDAGNVVAFEEMTRIIDTALAGSTTGPDSRDTNLDGIIDQGNSPNLYENYKDQGFEIVGIHAPEFSYEAELDNVVDALADLDVPWPIALDPTKRTFHSWQEGKTGYWPRIYLIDRDGHIRYDHHGEGRYAEIDAAVQELLAEHP